MELKSGMLGCCIVMLMLGASIFGTILISADANTHDVTKYRFETEVTGLFPIDTSPEFLDYDLSRNYTGYYTPDTVKNNIKYWGGATYKETSVNNYPVKYIPANEDITGRYDLSEYIADMTPAVDGYVDYYYINSPPIDIDHAAISIEHSISYSISSLLSALDLSDYEGEITIKSPSNNLNDLVFFMDTDSFLEPFTPVIYIGVGLTKQLADTNEEYSQYIACVSCKIITSTNTVNYYYENTATNQSFVKSSTLDKACVIYSDTVNNRTIDVMAHSDPEIKYMDISQGIRITEETT